MPAVLVILPFLHRPRAASHSAAPTLAVNLGSLHFLNVDSSQKLRSVTVPLGELIELEEGDVISPGSVQGKPCSLEAQLLTDRCRGDSARGSEGSACLLSCSWRPVPILGRGSSATGLDWFCCAGEMGLRAAGLALLICILSCWSQKLDPDGRNVCLYGRCSFYSFVLFLLSWPSADANALLCLLPFP